MKEIRDESTEQHHYLWLKVGHSLILHVRFVRACVTFKSIEV
jgi:hypothetical protein